MSEKAAELQNIPGKPLRMLLKLRIYKS